MCLLYETNLYHYISDCEWSKLTTITSLWLENKGAFVSMSMEMLLVSNELIHTLFSTEEAALGLPAEF
jgi:hypothetical protein